MTPQASSHEPPAPPTVLVVDDDQDIRDALVALLADEGYVPLPFANGREALEHLRADPTASLIVLDLMMPVMSGWSFYKEKSQNPLLADIPVVVMSAYADRAPPSATTVLKKPVGTADLLAAVAREIAGPEEPTAEVLETAERMWERLHRSGAGAARIPWSAASSEVRREMIALARGVLEKKGHPGTPRKPRNTPEDRRAICWRRDGDAESAEYGRSCATITRLPSADGQPTRVRVTSRDENGLDDPPVDLTFPPDHAEKRLEELKEHLRLEMLLRAIPRA